MASPETLAIDFRRQSARLVAQLTRAFGAENLTLAEDIAQETLLRAMQQWPMRGVPPNPEAWLSRVARNLTLDALRRERIYASQDALDSLTSGPTDQALMDEELEMLFLCAHPELSEESRIALVLKCLCGFSVGEIAKALMSSDSAVAQRLVRAKETLRSSGARFEMPEGADLRSRLQTILKALYLLFNEGYVAHSGDALTKDDLCDEAIILTSRLVETTPGNTPATHALLALMLLHSARMPSRIDESGALQLLEEQDRTKWDRSRISSGLFHLAQASTGDRLTPYHCEAAIAAAHCMSPSFDETDWVLVLSHYDDLMRVSPSPLARLNRAVAVWQVRGVEDALEELETLSPALDSYYLLHATRGRISGQPEHYAKALALTRNEAERRFIAKHQAGT